MIDFSTDFGARAAAHLRDDVVAWLTTVGAQGAPLPTPVWFAWDGERSVRVQSLPTARRVADVAAGRDRVSLNFDGDGRGGDIVVLSGRARIERDAPPLTAVEDYLTKYREHIARIGLTPESMGARYSTVLVIELTRLHGH